MAGELADRELLFEALATHLGFVTTERAGALRSHSERDAPISVTPAIGQRWIEQAILTAEQCAMVEAATSELLERHGGNLARCFDALGALARLRHKLEMRSEPPAGDSGMHATIDSIPVNGDHDRSGAGAESNQSTSDQQDDDDSFIAVDSPMLPAEVEDNGSEKASRFLGKTTSSGTRFRVLRPHAQGGIGKVSVAFDAELQREVALKQIKPERADDADSRARFLLEAEVTGRLEHPGIVPVYGLGRDDQGRPFYAMRFVRGTSLDEAIKKHHSGGHDSSARARTLELRNLLDRFAAVCHTIAYAHSRGVLHRDLKPANILLGPFNESLVVDWGLAKVFDRSPAAASGSAPASSRAAQADSPERDSQSTTPIEPDSISWGTPGFEEDSSPPLGFSSSTDTQAGTAFGTPAFMSPEQAEGRLDQLGVASDVYSLGAVLYTLLCGRAPFEYVWCDVTALIDRVRSGEFAPPRKVNADVPRALEAVCLKAMAMRPEDRFASAEDLAEEIHRWLSDEPVTCYREPALARLGRWGRRHRPDHRRGGRALDHGAWRTHGRNHPAPARTKQHGDPAAGRRAPARARQREGRGPSPP